MPTVELRRREETIDRFSAPAGRLLSTVLLGRHVPPASAVITEDGDPVSVFSSLEEGASYRVDVVEGYHLERFRELYEEGVSEGVVHASRRFSFDETGDLAATTDEHDEAGFLASVERLVRDTLTHYDLVEPGDRLLVAVSGETDSSAMLLALDALQSELDVELQALRMEEPRGPEPDSREHVRWLADEYGVDCREVSLAEIEALYGIDSVRDAFAGLADTRFARRQSSVINTVHHRVFEHVATTEGFDRVCVGMYLTEFVAGILTEVTTGVGTRYAPSVRIGPLTHVYPLVFLGKAELALYHRLETGVPAPAPSGLWADKPTEDHFMHYLADVLRSYWPGIGYWLVDASRRRTRPRTAEEFDRCPGCGKYVRAAAADERCVACRAFEAVGAL